MAYIAKQDVNTAFGSFKKGDKVSDIIGSQYSQFEKIEETPVKVSKQRKVIKEEILTDTSSDITSEII